MLNLIIYYIWVGFMFTMVVDISTWYYERQGNKLPEGTEWDWYTRSIAILIWPIGCIYFLAGYIIEITKKNNKNEK